MAEHDKKQEPPKPLTLVEGLEKTRKQLEETKDRIDAKMILLDAAIKIVKSDDDGGIVAFQDVMNEFGKIKH